jgi:RimJ/RimL family protein N-acetyltransferase
MKRLVMGHDMQVAEWAFNTFNMPPCNYDLAVGIVEDDRLVGAALWHAYNGSDVELSYYGPHTMTLGVAKALARVAVGYFGVSRVTARTSKKNKVMTRGIKGLGFEYEGIRHVAYSNGDDAVMYGLYGKNLARLAGRTLQ